MPYVRYACALFLLVLQAGCGRMPWTERSASSSAQDCGPPPLVNHGWTFRDDRPELPEGVSCLRGPLAIPAVDYAVGAPFRDPDHCWTPGAHSGTDLRAAAGRAVLASAPGEVIEVSRGDNSAWSVEVRFGDGWSFRVLHLSDIAVMVGDKVDVGDVLGLSGGERGRPGSGPYTTGPHLHFSLIYRRAFVDAEKYFCRTYPHSQARAACPKVCR